MPIAKADPAPLLPERPLLMLMDGHAMVHRAWHAIQTPLTLSTTNEDVRGVYAFVNTFIKAIQEWRPTHCAIAFDMSAPTFRHLKYADYKAQRPETPQDLRAQFPWVRRLMEAFSIPSSRWRSSRATISWGPFQGRPRSRTWTPSSSPGTQTLSSLFPPRCVWP